MIRGQWLEKGSAKVPSLFLCGPRVCGSKVSAPKTARTSGTNLLSFARESEDALADSHSSLSSEGAAVVDCADLIYCALEVAMFMKLSTSSCIFLSDGVFR